MAMKHIYVRTIVLIIIFFLKIRSGNAQQFDWVKGGGSTATDEVNWEGTHYLCTDPDGNVYALSNTLYYSIHTDTFTGTAYGNSILLTSYDCSGNMRWVKLITSSGGNCFSYGLAADSLGHIYVAGAMPNSTLHIGYDTTIATAVYKSQSLVQFDTNGHFNWIRQVGNNTLATFDGQLSIGSSLSVDANNNVHFFNSMKSGVPITPSITSQMGTYDLKYSAAGILLSVTRLAIDSTLEVVSTTIDKSTNNVFATGYRYGEFWTDYGGDSSAYNFICELDASRNIVWIDTVGDPPAPAEGIIEGLIADNNGHLYVSGQIDGYLVYKSDTTHYPTDAVGGYIGYVMKLDTAGNKKWISQCDGNSALGFTQVTVLSGNKIAAVGAFDVLASCKLYTGDTVTFNGGAGDVLFTIMDTAGNILKLQNVHGDGSEDDGIAITSDKAGNIYIGGSVADSLPVDCCGSIIPYVSVGGNTDFFVLKYGIDCNCTSTPVAAYTAIGTSTVSATYTGTMAGIDSVVWSFGDGTSGLGITTTHVYTVVGNANLCATVYTSCGWDVHCSNFLVNCTGTIASSFTDTGTIVRGYTYTGTTGAADTINWNFGDGHTATGATAIHTYSTSGTYTVCATVATPCGSNTACSTIVINCAPTSSFTSTGTTIRNFTYTGTTISLDSIKWNFGDGYTALGATATHTYSTSGTYTVCATVFTACGNNTSCSTIVINCAPTSSFTSTGTTTRDFTYTGTTISMDSVKWSFGDGYTALGTTAIHTYSASGTYTVCATVFTACGNNTSCSTIVINCTPVASFTYSGTDPINFTYTGTTTGVDSIKWNFGDGTTALGTTAIHTYSASATYTVCVTAFSACGNNTSCSTVVVNCTPVSSFTYTGVSPVNYTYTGSTFGLDSVVWHFGDGTTGTGTTTTHTYIASGTYSVCATAYALCGTNTSCSLITIDCSPTASFTISGTLTKDFTYTGTTAGLDSVVWNFGDASGATGTTALHAYTAVGTYTVCVTAYTPCGDNTSCSTLTISCLTAPIASFFDTGINPYTFGYIGTTSGYDSLTWNFGDGTSYTGVGTAFDVNHTYTAQGTYVACVTIYTSCGIDSVCEDVIVHTVGVPIVSIADIQVFPNPSTNQLNITGVTEDINYRLLTVTGITVEQGTLHTGINVISMQSCAPGVYVLEMIDKNGDQNMVRVVKE